MKKLTAAQAINLLTDAVLERGHDYKYSDHFSICVNVMNGKPACIVGLSLWRYFEQEGGEQHMLKQQNGTIMSVAECLKRAGILDISKKAQLIFSAAQVLQDGGQTWGVALNSASELHYTMERVEL